MSEQYSAPPDQSPSSAPVAGQPASASAPAQQAASVQQQAGLPGSAVAIADEKPEIVVGAALAAGFVFAMILRRIAR